VGLHVREVPVDTDLLGTFTGEIERKLPPRESAIAKARLAMKLDGAPLGLASEGTIGPDPLLPLLTIDRELVVLVDDEAGLVISEFQESPSIIVVAEQIRVGDSLDDLLTRSDFPHHHLIVKPAQGRSGPIIKGVSDLDRLKEAIAQCAAHSRNGKATVESDLRALSSPSRRRIIAEAAERLARRLSQQCPLCRAPGWGEVDTLTGVECPICFTELPLPRASVQGCLSCGHSETDNLHDTDRLNLVTFCPYCNP
jgi:hypothetical protein